MIQRLQSLYLAIVVALSLLFFTGSLFNCVDETGQPIRIMLTGMLTDKGGQSFANVNPLWPVTAILILIALLAIVTIFMFRKRRTQLTLALLLIFVSSALIVALASYAYVVTAVYRLAIIPGWRMALPLLIIIFSILAYRGIHKDENLVRSYDRLR